MKKSTVKLTENEKKKIQFVISCHLDGVPSLEDIEIMDTEEGYFPDYDHMRVKRFDTARKGWSNGYFQVSLIGQENILFLLFGDSEDPEAGRKFYFPKEGASPSPEWDFLSRNLEEDENGAKFLNKFSDCLSSCGVECYLCLTKCDYIFGVIGHFIEGEEEC